MRWGALIVGVLLFLMGSTFALQGAGVLPGSLMSGQTFWLIVGVLLLLAGIGLVVAGLRMRPARRL
jgi:uncharacterized integral membrane protein